MGNELTKNGMVKDKGLTAGELIEVLKGMPADSLVVMSKDAEGNGYSPLRTVDAVRYVPSCTYAGEVYLDDGCDEPGAVPAVAFWPVN